MTKVTIATPTEKQLRVAAVIAERNAKVLELVKAANGVVRDGHNGGTRTLTVSHLIEYVAENGIVYLCPGLEGKVFCLNPIVLDDAGLPVVDKWSVGGTIDARNMSVEDACLAYDSFGTVSKSYAIAASVWLGAFKPSEGERDLGALGLTVVGSDVKVDVNAKEDPDVVGKWMRDNLATEEQLRQIWANDPGLEGDKPTTLPEGVVTGRPPMLKPNK